jgi:hypothetical protein
MAIANGTDTRQWFSDKEALRELIDEIDSKGGIVGKPKMTAQELRAMLVAQGIRPEDNLLSRDIIRAKYPDEETVEE